MKRFSFAAAAIGVLVLGSLISAQAPADGQGPRGRRGGGRAGGRGGAPPAPLQNLQILPKDMTRPQVIQLMQEWNAALGVTCAHCHIFGGGGDPTNDFITDVKPQKNIARAMMRLTEGLDAPVAQAMNKPADQATRASCAMCHRGAATPVVAAGTPGAPPPPAPPKPGA